MKKFQKNNQSFVCVNCGKYVPEHPTSSRDHCIHCLYGLHVDINPGDRSNDCKGLLVPVGLRTSGDKKQIVYDCKRCGSRVYCIASQDDNSELLIDLVSKVWTDDI